MIVWETELNKALARAAAEQKCILLEFYSPQCIGCKQMDAVTYPDLSVESFIFEKVIPLKIPVSAEATARDYRVMFTPTLLVLDLYGKEHQRTVGYLPPEEMISSLLLGMGKAGIGNYQFNEAVVQFNTLLNGYPQSDFAPEAVYLRGVARYRSSQSPNALKETYQQLAAKYPGSGWSKRAEPFSLL